MKGLIGIISQNNVTSITQKLRRYIAQSSEDERRKIKCGSIEQAILRENIPNQFLSSDIKQSIKESDFSNSLEYKKGLIKCYLKKSIGDLLETEKQQRENVECLKHLNNFFKIETDKKDTQRNLQNIQKMQHECLELKKVLKNKFLMDQILLIYNKAKDESDKSLKDLVKRGELGTNIVVYIKTIKYCIPKIKDISVFIYWMFKVFKDLVEFDAIQKILRLDSLEEQKTQNMQNKQIYGFNVKPIKLKFKKKTKQIEKKKQFDSKQDKIRQINAFLQKMDKTFACVNKIHKEIKNKIEKLLNNQTDEEQKQKYLNILQQISRQEIIYKKKIGEQIFPTVYILTLVDTSTENSKNDQEESSVKFDMELWQKLCTLFGIEKMADINSMPSLLLSYRYSIQSSLIEEIKSKFKEIPKRIASKLITGGEIQFDQVCFFLEINTKISNNKKVLQDSDLSLSLVSTLITECMDQIDYQKIQKLLKIQRVIRQFKAKALAL